jgi:hypothetical protein
MAVTRIKKASGITWDDRLGANINLQTENTWAEIVKVCKMVPSQPALH